MLECLQNQAKGFLKTVRDRIGISLALQPKNQIHGRAAWQGWSRLFCRLKWYLKTKCQHVLQPLSLLEPSVPLLTLPPNLWPCQNVPLSSFLIISFQLVSQSNCGVALPLRTWLASRQLHRSSKLAAIFGQKSCSYSTDVRTQLDFLFIVVMYLLNLT